MINDNLILISGASKTGKSHSLAGIKNPEGVMYLCTEAGKRLPFRSKFKEFNIVDPLQVKEAFEKAEEMSEIHTIVIDSVTFLMDQYETQYVLTSNDTQKAWGTYAQYFKKLLQQWVAKSTKNVIITGHTLEVYSKTDMVVEKLVKIKGSIMNNGVEAYFSSVISTKKIPLTDLENYTNDLLTISDRDTRLGYKHVFQTQLTKDTVNERISCPEDMWDISETFINNDIQLVLDRLHTYYK